MPGHHAGTVKAKEAAPSQAPRVVDCFPENFRCQRRQVGVHSAMMKQALVALAGLVCLGQVASAQSLLDGTPFDQPINSPWAMLDSQDRFSFATAFGSMRQTQEYLPAFNPSEPLTSAYMMPDNKNSVDRVVELHPRSDIQFGGEIGFLYGKSTGSGYG